jgi:hypothetical protein
MAYATLGSRIVNVAMKLGNRQDLLQPAPGSGFTYTRIAGWLRDAYISVAFAHTFEQSEQTIQISTTPNADTYSYPDTVRAIKSLVGKNQTTGAPIIVDWKDINYIRKYASQYVPPNQPFVGVPAIVCPWANTIIFRPVPDANGPYVFYMDCWMKPVIIGDDLLSTQLQVPDDWLEVLDYDAAMRGHIELLERDKANEVTKLLYGYTDPNTGAKIAGITDRLGSRLQAQKPYMDWGMQPKFRSNYTAHR